MLSIAAGCPRCGSGFLYDGDWPKDAPRDMMAVAGRCSNCGTKFRSVWRSLQAMQKRAARMRAAAEIMAGIRDRWPAGSPVHEVAAQVVTRTPALIAGEGLQ